MAAMNRRLLKMALGALLLWAAAAGSERWPLGSAQPAGLPAPLSSNR
jgi:hypothetical protein